MNFAQLAHLLPAAVLVPALAFSAYSYLSLRVELRLLKRRTLTRSEFDERWSEIVTELESLRAQSKLAPVPESRPAPVNEWLTPDRTPNALNLNRRGQILRLHGKGRSPAEIAADLQISQGEVELMLKVHDWSPTPSL